MDVSRRDAMNAQIRQNSNLALSLGEQTVRMMAAGDQATLRMRDTVLANDFEKADFTRFANETELAPLILTQLSLVGSDGRFVGSNIDPTARKRVTLTCRNVSMCKCTSIRPRRRRSVCSRRPVGCLWASP